MARAELKRIEEIALNTNNDTEFKKAYAMLTSQRQSQIIAEILVGKYKENKKDFKKWFSIKIWLGDEITPYCQKLFQEFFEMKTNLA